MPWTIDLRLRAWPDAAREVRAALSELKLASAQLDDLCLLVSELVSSCVLSAATGEVGICVSVDPRVVRAEVLGRVALEVQPGRELRRARNALFDRLTSRWGLIASGSGGAWMELDRDIALECAERGARLRVRSAVVHERAASLHLRAARIHRQLEAVSRSRGQLERAEREAVRAAAAQRRGEAELFRARRSVAGA